MVWRSRKLYLIRMCFKQWKTICYLTCYIMQLIFVFVKTSESCLKLSFGTHKYQWDKWENKVNSTWKWESTWYGISKVKRIKTYCKILGFLRCTSYNSYNKGKILMLAMIKWNTFSHMHFKPWLDGIGMVIWRRTVVNKVSTGASENTMLFLQSFINVSV